MSEKFEKEIEKASMRKLTEDPLSNTEYALRVRNHFQSVNEATARLLKICCGLTPTDWYLSIDFHPAPDDNVFSLTVHNGEGDNCSVTHSDFASGLAKLIMTLLDHGPFPLGMYND